MTIHGKSSRYSQEEYSWQLEKLPRVLMSGKQLERLLYYLTLFFISVHWGVLLGGDKYIVLFRPKFRIWRCSTKYLLFIAQTGNFLGDTRERTAGYAEVFRWFYNYRLRSSEPAGKTNGWQQVSAASPKHLPQKRCWAAVKVKNA
jgi:hypothetical protein